MVKKKHTRIIGAQRAITTPILFFAAKEKGTNTNHLVEPEHIFNSVCAVTLRKELMPLESSYWNSHDIFCRANKRLNLYIKTKRNP